MTGKTPTRREILGNNVLPSFIRRRYIHLCFLTFGVFGHYPSPSRPQAWLPERQNWNFAHDLVMSWVKYYTALGGGVANIKHQSHDANLRITSNLLCLFGL